MSSCQVETVIVGAGQAGLALSYWLKHEGRGHVVLERAPAVANAWRNQRWDSFTLVTPNFQVRMPGAEYQGNDPYGFMFLAEVVKYFDDYVARFELPVHCGVDVHSVEKAREGYLVRTSEGAYNAENVVIATGLYQASKIPKLNEDLSQEILQIHSMITKVPLRFLLEQFWWSGQASQVPKLLKSFTRAEERSTSPSAVPDASRDAIAAETSTIGLPAWVCSIRRSAN